MVTKAYILIETRVGQSRAVVQGLRSLEGVSSAEIVTGTIDVIALVEAPDMVTVADLVTGRVQAIAGVMRTVTCVATG